MQGKIFLSGVLISVLITIPAYAGNSWLEALGFGQSTSSKTSNQLLKLQKTRDEILQKYLGSTQNLAGVLDQLGQALGVSSDAKLAEIRSLKVQTLEDQDFQQIQQQLSETATAIKQQLQSGQKLSVESVQLYLNCLTKLNGLWQKSQSLLPKVKSLVQQTQGILKTAPLQDKLKLQEILSPALSVAKNLPSQLLVQKDLLISLSNFALDNNIKLPNKVQSSLGTLSK